MAHDKYSNDKTTHTHIHMHLGLYAKYLSTANSIISLKQRNISSKTLHWHICIYIYMSLKSTLAMMEMKNDSTVVVG